MTILLLAKLLALAAGCSCLIGGTGLWGLAYLIGRGAVGKVLREAAAVVAGLGVVMLGWAVLWG